MTQDQTLKVINHAGDIAIMGSETELEGPLNVRLEDGNVRIDCLSGPLDLRLEDGNVKAHNLRREKVLL